MLQAVAALLVSGCDRAGPDPIDSGDNAMAEQRPISQPADRFMVTAAHPLAVQAGVDVLREGGTAMDAAIAVQMVLGFVEPPESGIGGGGFLLYHDHRSGAHFYDGREVAPAAVEEEHFTLLGRAMPLSLAVVSGRSVGVPGLLSMLEHAHRRHGSLPWSRLFETAIQHAEQGIAMPDRLQQQIRQDRSLRLFGDTRRYFVRQSRDAAPRLRNPDLAQTLRQIADQGADAFYGGDIGARFVARARARWPLSSRITTDDLKAYTPLERTPQCGSYRDWTICGPPPPSSAGIALIQMLGILEHFPISELAPDSTAAMHLIAEASRLAFADRNRYVGDPAFSEVPTAGLVDPAYLQARAALIDPSRAMTSVLPGVPAGGDSEHALGVPPEDETFGTTHLSIVDTQGNVAALTSSNESPFGTRMMVDGYIINNQLTDFTFTAHLPDGSEHPNAPAAGKRPRSSMAPVIVLDRDGNVRLVIGSRGGARIIGYVLKVLIGVLDWDMTLQQAIDLPNFLHRGVAFELEQGTPIARHRDVLRSMGHTVSVTALTSGLHGIERVENQWRGGADPRLDGIAAGDQTRMPSAGM